MKGRLYCQRAVFAVQVRKYGQQRLRTVKLGTFSLDFPTIRRRGNIIGYPSSTELGQYRTIRWQRRRCLFRHLLLADFSIYLQ